MSTRNILDFGALPDGVHNSTAAIQEALDAGPGTVLVPPGIFLTGTLRLRSGNELRLSDGAVLQASIQWEDYNQPEEFSQNWYSLNNEQWDWRHLILAVGVENVAITGHGIIDGSGRDFFGAPKPYPPESLIWRNGLANRKSEEIGRPGQMVEFCECRNVKVSGLTLRNAPSWTLYFYGCSQVEVEGLVIRNPPVAANTDGIDVDCCTQVKITDCDIDTGDDAIAIRANPRHLAAPDKTSDGIVVSHCRLASSSSVVRCGVGSTAIRHVVLEDLMIERGGIGFDLMASYGASGLEINDVLVRNVHMRDVAYPILFRGVAKSELGAITNVLVEGVNAECFAELMISGRHLKELHDICLKDVCLREIPNPVLLPQGAKVQGFGLNVQSAFNLHLENVRFESTDIP